MKSPIKIFIEHSDRFRSVNILSNSDFKMAQAVERMCPAVKFADDCDYNQQSEHEKTAEKKRNLTMKYGQEQRNIVKRRLRLEHWVDAELNKLYGITDPNDTHPCDPDLDEIIKLDTEEEKRKMIMEMIISCKEADEVMQVFVNELLERMKAL
ncbi:hypothetical protein EB796_017488 [Bugula neritina]|uniref:Uncharacterized protein n=1 Tax=Bugula neritina TaxID=10212 RepID=A0A7J7JDN7_BUGNE|nr:hypothetical protein EB796_017488 [Bugula neritina]